MRVACARAVLRTDFLRSMPICAFAYSCHIAVLPVFYSMKNPTEKRFDRARCSHARQPTTALTALSQVRTRSYLFVTVLYFVSGLFGYLFFRDNAGGRQLSSFLAFSLSLSFSSLSLLFLFV